MKTKKIKKTGFGLDELTFLVCSPELIRKLIKSIDTFSLTIEEVNNIISKPNIKYYDLYFRVFKKGSEEVEFHSFQEKSKRMKDLTIEKFCDPKPWNLSERSDVWLHIFNGEYTELIYRVLPQKNKK